MPVADGTWSTSTIIVNQIAGFAQTVILSDLPLPANLSCTAIDPATIPNGSGEATVSCSSTIEGSYNLTVIAASGLLRHNATATFNFVASTFPDFTIAATSPVTLVSGTTTTSNVTVTSQGGFDSQVNLTSTITPNIGLEVSLNPQELISGSELSTATFKSSSPGDYSVYITGESGTLSHTITLIVLVTLAGIPDFAISPASDSINIQSGNLGTTKITLTPKNGFTDSVTLAIVSPSSASCTLSPNSIQSQGESTLTCYGNTPGSYTVMIRASGSAISHTTAVHVRVTTYSPAAPAPSITPRPSLPFIYSLIGAVIIIALARTLISLRKSKRSKVSDPRL